MTRSKRLQPIDRIAKNNEKLAGQRASESGRTLAAQESRLRDLCAYRDQYARQLETAGGLDAFRLRDYHAFLARLNDAIRQQEALVEKLRSRHRQTEEEWLASRVHSQAVDKLLERFRDGEQRQETRREQRTSDEHAGRSRERTDKA